MMSWGRVNAALRTGRPVIETVTGLLSFHTYFWDRTLEQDHGISRRTLQRTRAKLARLGLIKHVSWMNSRYGGQQGWKLSSRMGTALRQFADKIDDWRKDTRPERIRKDEQLVELLR